MQGNDHVVRSRIITNCIIKVIPSGRRNTSQKTRRVSRFISLFQFLRFKSIDKIWRKKIFKFVTRHFPSQTIAFFLFLFFFFRTVLYCLIIVSLRTTFQHNVQFTCLFRKLKAHDRRMEQKFSWFARAVITCLNYACSPVFIVSSSSRYIYAYVFLRDLVIVSTLYKGNETKEHCQTISQLYPKNIFFAHKISFSLVSNLSLSSIPRFTFVREARQVPFNPFVGARIILLCQSRSTHSIDKQYENIDIFPFFSFL